jgi:hypothetical protein
MIALNIIQESEELSILREWVVSPFLKCRVSDDILNILSQI